MLRVVIESPYAAPTKEGIKLNITYAKAAMRHSLRLGEAPYASHLLFAATDILDDSKPEERVQGMQAGFAWGEKAELCAVYVDNGVSSGMMEGMRRAFNLNIPVQVRSTLFKSHIVTVTSESSFILAKERVEAFLQGI
jgi:hypothetical protein